VKFMKNVTAHYNIYFNAKELLSESEVAIKNTLIDDYNLVLAIFPKPSEQAAANEIANLNEVIKKANTIAVEKYESNWLDDAYLLLANAEYLKGDYYNAVEYYKYVSLTFPESKKSKLAAYLGQTKTEFVLGNITAADTILQKAIKLKSKKLAGDVAALQAQLALEQQNIPFAIKHLQKAVNLTHLKDKKIRWMFILAQLQEIINKTDDAYLNYDKIAKSNAPFDLSFNADLARIRIIESAKGKQFNRIETLSKLLKQDKNKEYKEQIYYQIGLAYADLNQLDKAISFLQTSAHTTPSTEKQKGLSYLKLAKLNFEVLKNYPKAQLYYDSTLQFLPKNYPDYDNIALKAENLQYLADRLTIISTESYSLKLANLSASELSAKVDSLMIDLQKSNQPKADLKVSNTIINPSSIQIGNQKGSVFYFYNPTAVSQGLNEFKKRWGNRKLSDDWRSNTSGLNSNDAKSGILNPTSFNSAQPVLPNRDSVQANFEKNIPFSPAAKALANDKISTALYEIAVFYKDILKDEVEAIAAFNALILNYPNYINMAAVYFQLYRLSQQTDLAKSEEYQKQLLEKFPQSIYAKTISNPNFGKEEILADVIVADYYCMTYELYQQRAYQKVLSQIEFLKQDLHSFRSLEAQFDYLKTLALGHTEKLSIFYISLNSLLEKYPNDNEIGSLVKQQIAFINKNKNIFEQRLTALVDKEEIKPAVLPEVLVYIPKKDEIRVPPSPNQETVINKEPVVSQISKPVEIIPKKEIEIESPKDIVFSDNTRQRHVLVIDINDAKVNIAKPFSLLSQYFYSKYSTSAVNLVIRLIGNSDKFIIVSGNFYAKTEVEKIASELKESLPKIMEGQTNQYTFFVISETNLGLVKDRSAIEQYIKYNSERK
jgi:hypothetical protein